MMKDWKIKQELYHRLNRTHDDDLKEVEVEIDDDIVGNAIRYFRESDIGWIYPAKSYAVGIMYAYWLSKDYDEDMYDLLNDKDLLYGNDPHFKPYHEDKETYDKIIQSVCPFDENKGMVSDIKYWYKQEFLL